jgi:hypothetical protein
VHCIEIVGIPGFGHQRHHPVMGVLAISLEWDEADALTGAQGEYRQRIRVGGTS